MKLLNSVLVCCLLPIAAVSLHAQNVVLGRVVGQNTLIMKSSAPNLVEGREMTNPQGVALDTSTSTPAIYVSDTGNNRVLVWKNAASFQNGAFADLVIGQKDMISTGQNGPGTNFTKGLNAPTGLVVDGQGNLWVLDSGNNRILRYPKPLVQPDPFKADQVIGQPGFTTSGTNTGGLSASSLSFTTYRGPLRGGLALDKQGNLWVTDAGNNRVLRFPADPANAGRVLGTADLVLGQSVFTTNTSTNTINNKSQMNTPAGIAVDPFGNVFVSDAIHRVLVFSPQPAFSSGQNAINFIGGILNQQGGAMNPPTRQSLNSPAGIAIVPGTNEVLVNDTFNNRVLKFPPPGPLWPSSGPPSANLVIGQPSDSANKSGVGASLLSAPVDVAASGSDLFVADSRNNRVLDFPNGSTTAVRVLGQLGMDYNAPNLIEGRELYLVGFLPVGNNNFATIGGGVAVDTTGAVPHLFITDPGNNRVLGYCDARKAKQGDKADLVIGQPDFYHSMANGDGGTTPNNQYLWAPSGITVDPAGSLYIADTGNGRVLRFAAPCSQPAGQQSFPVANLVIGQADFVSHTTDPSQSTMSAPFGVALTPEGFLLISDIFQNRVLRFEKPQGGDFSNGQNAAVVLGQPDFYTTTGNSADNQMNSPRHLAVDSRGRLYVADFFNNRFIVFSDAAHTLSNTSGFSVYTEETSNKYLNRPEGIAVNQATGEIWVAPANETRILKYPEFNTLALAPYATAQALTATGPLAVALDSQGDVFVAESGNRVSEYFPEVDPVNGASFVTGRELAPGVIASVWAKRGSTPATNAKSLPLPTDMAGVQVIVGGTPAPLFYAGDSAYPGYVQINFQVPNNAPSSGFIDTQVLDSATQQVLGAGVLSMKAAAPALFVANAGTGQVAALNYDPNAKQYSCNGASAPASSGCPNGTRPVKGGETLVLYLTGQGYQSGWTKDGDAPTGAVNTDGQNPLVLINTAFVPGQNVQYSGAAPGFVGLWQINVKVPNDTIAPGQANPVAVLYRDVPSSINGTPKTVIQVQ